MAFYFGGMLASYRAPARHTLCGVLVAILSFAVSLAVNFGTAVFFETHKDPLANLRTEGQILLTAVLFLVSVVAAYLGARRGKSVYVSQSGSHP